MHHDGSALAKLYVSAHHTCQIYKSRHIRSQFSSRRPQLPSTQGIDPVSHTTDVLLYFGQVRVDYQMSQCFSAFKKHLSDNGLDAIFAGRLDQKEAGPSSIGAQMTSLAPDLLKDLLVRSHQIGEQLASAAPNAFRDLLARAKISNTDSDLTSSLGERLAAPMIRDFLAIFTGPEAKAFDFDDMSDAPLITICLDLMMHNKPEVFQLALELLTRTFSQREDVVIALESSQMLFSAKAIEAHSILKSELDVLKNDIESYETWGVENDFSPQDRTVHERVQRVLTRLTYLCTLGDHEETDIPNAENQSLFRNLLVHRVVLLALEIEEANTDLDSESADLVSIKKMAFRFISRFVLKNEKNQQIIFNSGFGIFVEALKSHTYIFDAIDVMIATFDHNIHLANTVPEHLLNRVATIIDNAHKQGWTVPGILTFFEKLAVVDEKPIRRNQELILHIMGQPKFQDRVMVLYSPPSESDETMSRVAMHLKFLSSKDRFLEYHYELMRLLSKLCAGRAGISEIRLQVNSTSPHLFFNLIISAGSRSRDLRACREACRLPRLRIVSQMLAMTMHFRVDIESGFEQALYSPEHISLLIQEKGASLTQKQVFSEVLYHVFLDAQAHAMQLNSVLRSSNILMFYQLELETFAKKPSLTLDEQTYILSAVFPCINDILKQLKNEANNDEVRIAVAKHAQELAGKLDGCLTATQLMHLCEQVDEIHPSASGQLQGLVFPMDDPGQHAREPEDDSCYRHGSAYSRFIKALRNTPEVRMAMDEDHQKLVSCFLDVEAITDPDDPEYRRRLELKDGSEAYRRAKADGRKNKIKFEALCKRIVHYMETYSEDFSPSTFVDCLLILSSIVQRSIASYKMKDVQLVGEEAVEAARLEMVEAQDKMAASGAAALCVHLFRSKRDAIACSAIDLAIYMLEGGNMRVQEAMYEAMLSTPDAIKAIESRLLRAQAR